MLSIRYVRFHAKLTQITPAGVIGAAKDRINCYRGLKVVSQALLRFSLRQSRKKDCTTVVAAPVLPVGYVVSASRIAHRRVILTGYRLADLLTTDTQTWI